MQKLSFTKKIKNLQKFYDEALTLNPKCQNMQATDGVPTLIFSAQLSQSEIDDYYRFEANFSEISVHDNLVGYLRTDVTGFTNDLIFNFAADNIEMGITQAGKTRVVADFMKDIYYYIQTFSLYEAVVDIQKAIDDGLDPDLAPFITEQRLTQFKQKIMDFLT